MLKLGRYPPKKIQSSHLKFEAGIHSLHNLFWLVKDTFLTTTEATSSSTFESYFYPRKPLFTAIKEITILFSTH